MKGNSATKDVYDAPNVQRQDRARMMPASRYRKTGRLSDWNELLSLCEARPHVRGGRLDA